MTAQLAARLTDLTVFPAAVAFLGFAVHRLAIIRGGRADSAQRDVAGFALCTGAALLLDAPSVLALLDRWLPPPEGGLLIDCQLREAAVAFLALMAPALERPAGGPLPARRRRRVRLAAAVQATGLALFLASGVTVRGPYVVAAAGRGWVLASYNALFTGYACWCLAVLVRALAGHTHRLPPSALRTGLRLTTLAAAVAAVWTLWTLDDVAANLAHGRQRLDEDLVSATLSAVTAVLFTCGATATLWGERIVAPLRAARRFRALTPLWSALHSQLPEIALDPGAAVRRPRLREAEFALYRRVIEIRDGSLALRSYQQPEAVAWAGEALARSPAADAEAVLEAAVIAAALANRRAGRVPGPGPEGPRPPAPAERPGQALETVEDEAAWLIRVARAFTGSPAVGAVRRRMRERTGEEQLT
ncbi:MAB_1171c family putative transporter [Streptomyces sp. HPF1205]|uniref:MAB_1171c family putative transporter n=1 Tax=Streptomyces sp. HPF1205 TaxID=2873262 RepID=UPI001CECD977|nr:MAB_1171c family putative transporter [Streptomyces sp. HPF1205]